MSLATWLLSAALVVPAPQSPLLAAPQSGPGAASQAASDPLELAQAQFARGDYRAAIATLSAAIDQHPHDARLFHWRSRCYLEQNDFARATSDGERAVLEQPDDSEYRRWLGRVYGAAAEQERSFWLARKVKQAFEDAVRLNPLNVAARRDLTEFYLEAPWIIGGGSGKALNQVSAIAQVDPVAGYLARAAYARHEKRFDEAEANYTKMLALRPRRIEPYLEVADFYESRGDAGKLANAIEQGAALDPSDARLTYYSGVALVMANREPDEADAFLRKYLATSPRLDWPSHASAHEWLGRLHERLGHASIAADEYRATLALDPDRKSARDALRRVTEARP
jgi:tetratricopeptide (TPR) repeat protein